MKKSKKDIEAEADQIIDTFAELEAQLANAGTRVLKALRRRLAVIYVSQMYGDEIPSLPENRHRWWCLNHVDLMAPIRNIYLGNVDLDFSEAEAQLIADAEAAAKSFDEQRTTDNKQI